MVFIVKNIKKIILINVVDKKCSEKDCNGQPRFNYKIEKKLYIVRNIKREIW